jgi:GDP-L-fucose synthase
MLLHEEQSGRFLRRPKQDYPAATVAEFCTAVLSFRGRIETDPSRSDGTMHKLMDVDRLTALGWRARIDLQAGIAETYRWYLDNLATARQ